MFTAFLVQLQKLGKRTSWVPRVGLPGAEAPLASTLGSITGTSSAQQDTGPYPDPPCLPQSDPLCQPQVQSPGFSAAPLPFPRLDLEPQHLLPCLHLPVFAGTGGREVREWRALKSWPSTICIGKTCVLKARASRVGHRHTCGSPRPGCSERRGVCVHGEELAVSSALHVRTWTSKSGIQTDARTQWKEIHRAKSFAAAAPGAHGARATGKGRAGGGRGRGGEPGDMDGDGPHPSARSAGRALAAACGPSPLRSGGRLGTAAVRGVLASPAVEAGPGWHHACAAESAPLLQVATVITQPSPVCLAKTGDKSLCQDALWVHCTGSGSTVTTHPCPRGQQSPSGARGRTKGFSRYGQILVCKLLRGITIHESLLNDD